LLHNPENPFILGIGVQTKISHEITAPSLLPRVCETIIFMALGHVLGVNVEKNLPARQQFFLKKAVHQRNANRIGVRAVNIFAKKNGIIRKF
jgi:hypothetical protein